MLRTRAIALSIAVALSASFSALAAETPQKEPSPILTSAEEPLGLFKVMRITLENAPKLKIQAMLLNATRAQEQIATGGFDINTYVIAGFQNLKQTNWVLDDLEPEHRAIFARISPDYPRHDTRNKDIPYITTGLAKKFRTGISATLDASIQRTDHRQTIPRVPPTVTTNEGKVKFNVKIPLLKNSGSVAAAADENAAKLNTQASVATLQHTLTSVMLNAINAYWDYKRATVFKKMMDKSLVRVEGWAGSSSNASLQGFLENTKGKVTDAQQNLEESRIALARAMGIPAKETSKMGTPVTDLPLDWDAVLASFDPEAMGEKWQEIAIANRLDLKAAGYKLEAAKVQQQKARKNLLPVLNLDLGVGSVGFRHYDSASDFVGSLNSNVRGPETYGSLTFRYPIGNNVAKGVHSLRNLAYQQSKIEYGEAQRGVRLSVGETVSNVHGRLQKTSQMSKTYSSYESAIQQMQEDRNVLSSITSISNLIDTEEKYQNALEEFSIAVVDVAKAVAEARFNTGTLIEIPGDSIEEADVRMEQIISLPN